jgi:WD40 repeat protein
VLSGGWDGQLRFWDASQGTQVSSLQAAKKPVSACAISPDGRQWLSGSMEGLLAHWDVLTRQQLSMFLAHGRPISAIVFAPDGRMMATASWDCNVIIWNSDREREGRTLSGHSDIVAGCRFTPDGQTLVSWGHDRTVRVWDVSRARQTGQLSGHGEHVSAGAVSPEGRWAATGSDDGTLKLWDLTTQREAASVALAGEVRGCWFLLSGDGLVAVDANGQLTLHALPGLEEQTRLLTRLAVQCGELAPSGSQIALGCGDGRVHFIAVDGFDTQPLLITATQTSRRAQTVLQRLVGKSHVIQAFLCTCPACRQPFELPQVDPAQPTPCPKCHRQLRVGVVTRPG